MEDSISGSPPYVIPSLSCPGGVPTDNPEGGAGDGKGWGEKASSDSRCCFCTSSMDLSRAGHWGLILRSSQLVHIMSGQVC